MVNCALCTNDANEKYDRYFVVPGPCMVPNCYALCEEHKDEQLFFEDFYNEDYTLKKRDIDKKE